MARLLTEALGTFFLVLSICLATASGNALAPLAIGGTLMGMVYMGAHVSGAQYNPAVSLALAIGGALTPAEMLRYWAAQLAGGAAAAFTALAITGTPVPIHPGAGVTPVTAVLVEALGTFALVLVVLNVATAKANEGKEFYGLAIGMTVIGAAWTMGGISGGAFNPAVGTALSTAGGDGFSDAWIYWVGPLAGAALAAMAYRVQQG
ncbi:MAG: aquaporin [Gemmatimonadales bacterium]|nr:aquaporin [Gemmatimonadales bacterium]